MICYVMLFLLVTRWCCVISVCLIISHSVSLSALSAIPPSAGQAGDWGGLGPSQESQDNP